MKFFSACAAVMAFAASAFAQTADFDPIFTPASGQVVPAGSTLKITWQAPPKYAGEKITIHLIGGETQNTQVPLLDIVAGIDNSAESYDWAVPADLGAAKFYGLVIKLQRDPSIYQYSNPFQIQAGAGVSTTSTTSTPATSASSTASATTTLTTSEGTKTVTLSSSSTVIKTTSTVSSSTKVTTTDCTTSTIVPQCKNCTATTLTSVSKPPVVLTSTGAVPTKTAVVTPPPAVVTAGASRIGAGSVAAVAGLVLVAFAL